MLARFIQALGLLAARQLLVDGDPDKIRAILAVVAHCIDSPKSAAREPDPRRFIPDSFSCHDDFGYPLLTA
jgi:hypothetical protein